MLREEIYGMADKDLALITNRLQVPLIVGDILNGEGALTDEVYRGLHEVLSEDQPDSALLSIALSAHTIADRNINRVSSFKVLRMECQRIIVEYGMMWLKNAQSQTLDNNMVFDTLVHIPEDLNCLAGLLELTKTTLQDHDKDAADLCSILIAQAGAQCLVAETFLESMESISSNDKNTWNVPSEDDAINADMSGVIADQAMQTTYANNVIQFPNGRA